MYKHTSELSPGQLRSIIDYFIGILFEEFRFVQFRNVPRSFWKKGQE